MNESSLQKIKQRYGIIGNNAGLNHALDIALQVAPTDLSVLVTGENGSGKEAFARVIHDNSTRKNKKFFTVNCGSIPEGTIDSELFGHEKGSFTGAVGEHEGYFGVADGGTLFLDEVGELPLSTQARLLRVLSSGEYIRVGSSEIRKTNVRIVAATNVNIPKAITEGKFREDLYYRLNTIPVHVPPLRERGQDIVLIFMKFALEMSEKYGMPPLMLTEDAKQRLMQYSWPGNVRQLKSVTENMSITAPDRTVSAAVLDDYIPNDRQTTELATVNNASEHQYATEREYLIRFLFGLREEIKDLKTLVAKQDQRLQELSAQPHTVSAPTMSAEYVEEEPDKASLSELNKEAIRKSLERHNGRKKDVAEELDISTRTLSRKIKEYGW